MTILSAQTIRGRGLLTPCLEAGIHQGTSYGLGPCGYDLRLVLPEDAKSYVIEPGEFLLASAIEYFVLPDDVACFIKDKSSWARRGLTVQNTIAEPGWCGFLTLELINHSRGSILLHAGQGIAQAVFEFLDQPTQIPYSGKYQDQQWGPQGART